MDLYNVAKLKRTHEGVSLQSMICTRQGFGWLLPANIQNKTTGNIYDLSRKINWKKEVVKAEQKGEARGRRRRRKQ